MAAFFASPGRVVLLMLEGTTFVVGTVGLLPVMEMFPLVASEVFVDIVKFGGKNCGCPKALITGGLTIPLGPVAREFALVVDIVAKELVAVVVMSSPPPNGLVDSDWLLVGSIGAFILAVAMLPGGLAMFPVTRSRNLIKSDQQPQNTLLEFPVNMLLFQSVQKDTRTTDLWA